MQPMSAEPIEQDRPGPSMYRSEPAGIPQELVGVSRSMERLMQSLDELGHMIPQIESRLSPVLVEGGVLATTGRPQDGHAPLRCGLAESIEMRAAQVEELTQYLRGIHGRIDL